MASHILRECRIFISGSCRVREVVNCVGIRSGAQEIACTALTFKWCLLIITLATGDSAKVIVVGQGLLLL